ncbi:hypothetical protein LZC95_24260 [Pendulispora brunnea]|uniref:Uncharacterized protein n=1 Tax=Pendulispora brunnea TaxID=2905690 RepID=A0ABZ2KML9_9BACT
MQLVDPPQSPIHSWKTFGTQYLMIVVSILTALGFEQVVMSVRRSNGAEAAQREIEEELRTNLKDVRASFQHNAARIKALEVWDAEALRELTSSAPNPANQQRLIASAKEIWYREGIWTPNLQRAAWDVAIANQSAGNIPTATLRKYATAYTFQHDAAQYLALNFMTTLDESHAIDVLADIDVGKAAMQDVLHITRQLSHILKQTQNQLHHMEEGLAAALPGESASTIAPPPPSPAAAR